jgi:hypothetical protein
MKYIFKAGFLAVFLMGTSMARADLSNGLKAYYPFDNCTGQDMASGNDALVVGAPACIDGPSGKAFGFHASGDVLQVATSPEFDFAKGVSFAAYVNPTKLKVGSQVIINKWVPAYEDKNLFVTPEGRVGFYMVDCMWGEPMVSKTRLPLKKWSSVVGTYDGKLARIYLNGKLAGKIKLQRQCSIANDVGNLYIGDNPERAYEGNVPFQGGIDEVRIYNRALTAAEVQEYSKLPH